VELQHIARRILLITQQQQLNEQTNADDNEEEQPRRRQQQQQQQQGVFSLKYFDNAKKTNTMPPTHSTEAAESFEAYDIETHGGVEYIKVFAGEGVILKDHEDIWRMLSTSYTPLKWGEHFQSSQTIPQEKKRRISSGADLNLN